MQINKMAFVALTIFAQAFVPKLSAQGDLNTKNNPPQYRLADMGRHIHYHIVELRTLGGTFTQPGGINDRGEIEGWSELAGDNVQHAFLLSHGRLIDIPTLGGPNSIAGWAPSNSG